MKEFIYSKAVGILSTALLKHLILHSAFHNFLAIAE